MPGAPASRRLLALALPLLPSERLSRPDPEAPLVLVASDRGRQIIRAANEAALAQGLGPGLALADARAAVPDVVVAAFDPEGDAACLDWLARGATRWSPLVRACPPHGLIIDITGCAHLFGGEASLVADAVTRLARLGFSAQPALAATPAAAMALARFGGERVGDLPLAALSDLDNVQTALRRAGLKRVGEVAKLPRAALASRFGEALVAALDQLLETAPQPLDALLPAAPVVVQRRFAQPVASHDAVRAALEKLLLAANVKLTAIGAGGRRFALALYRADGHVAELALDTAAPQRDPAVLLRLFDERIAALNDPLDPGFGYDLLRLAVPDTAPLAETQLGLDGGALAETQLTQLVDRLAARLGRGRLKRLVRADSHIPEQASFELPFDQLASLPLVGRVDSRAARRGGGVASSDHADDPHPGPRFARLSPSPQGGGSLAPGEPPGRPIRLFDPPQPIEVMAEVPDGPPRRFRWRGRVHDVMAHEGPERIAAQWWRRKDGAGLTRDYWRVEAADGRRYWLFRHGLYERETDSPRWYVHGLFA